MKKITIALIFLFLFFAFLAFFDRGYQLKIEIDLENIDPLDIDENYAKNIEKEILNLNEVKEIVLFSSEYGLNIYCKFKKFIDKNKATDKIQRLLAPYNFENVNYNDKYYLKYDYFFVIYSNDNDYYSLENKADLIYKEILKLKISNDVKIFGLQQKAINIYFSDDDLTRYNLSTFDIKSIIKKNNFKSNYIYDDFSKSLNTKIKDENDIKNIMINYKKGDFSLKLSDIFEIKKEIKTPLKRAIYYKDKNALVVALSLKKPYPIWLLKYKFSNYDVEIFKINKLKKTQIYFDYNSDFKTLFEFYKKIQKEEKGANLYFLAQNAPKTDNIEDFDEIKNNRIIIFSNSKFKIQNLNTCLIPNKISNVEYKIDEFKKNKFALAKEEIFDFLAQNSFGVFCGYFYENNDKIEIYLKNKSDFIYSKKFKILISKDEILDSKLNLKEYLIIRKNFKRIESSKTKKSFCL